MSHKSLSAFNYAPTDLVTCVFHSHIHFSKVVSQEWLCESFIYNFPIVISGIVFVVHSLVSHKSSRYSASHHRPLPHPSGIGHKSSQLLNPKFIMHLPSHHTLSLFLLSCALLSGGIIPRLKGGGLQSSSITPLQPVQPVLTFVTTTKSLESSANTQKSPASASLLSLPLATTHPKHICHECNDTFSLEAFVSLMQV